jgi:hypothetical protein
MIIRACASGLYHYRNETQAWERASVNHCFHIQTIVSFGNQSTTVVDCPSRTLQKWLAYCSAHTTPTRPSSQPFNSHQSYHVMSMMTKKRAAVPVDLELKQRPLDKRSRMEEMNSSAPSLWKGASNQKDAKPTTNFTHVHLQILKVLYSQQNLDQDDGEVNNEQWKCVEDFLKERQVVKTMATKVRSTEAIQKKSTTFKELVENFNVTKSQILSHDTALRPSYRRPTIKAGVSISTTRSPSSLVHPTTRVLPAQFFSGTCRFGSVSSPGSFRKSQFSAIKQQQQQQIPLEVDGNPFGIISTFLKQKHQLTLARFQRSSAPLLSLVEDLEGRIKCLTSKLEEIAERRKRCGLGFLLVDQALRNNESFDVQSLEEARVRMETKLEFWRILLEETTSTIALMHGK